jgi:hypothetical protein
MFDFSDTETHEHKQHLLFVDIDTNLPKNIEDIDKRMFPYPVLDCAPEFKIFTQDDLLSADECEYLIWLAETLPSWPVGTMNFWSERNVGLLTDIPKHKHASVITAQLVLDIHDRIRRFISDSFGFECYADQIGIVRWPPGSFQMPHVDEVPELDRIAGSVVYLNDSYAGGRTYYPYYGKENTPRTGTIFAHDPGQAHLHGVTQILNTTRYTISSTWSKNPKDSRYESYLKSLKSYIDVVQHDGSLGAHT